MADSEYDLLLGRLALHYKLLTREQIGEAMRQRQAAGSTLALGEYLVVAGLLDRPTLQRLEMAREELLRRQGQASPAPSAAPSATPPAPPTPAVAPAVSPSPAGPAEGILGYRPGITLGELLAAAAAAGASDLHVHAEAPLKLRVHGEIRDATPRPLSAEETATLIFGFLSDELRGRLEADWQVDFAAAIPGGGGRFRASAYRQQRGLDAIFRLIPPEAPRLADLGLPDSLAALTEYPQGLVLLTGPAGCGKSSTLAALVRLISEARPEHVITLEDPIEYVFPSARALINQRQVGSHTGSFARALRAALREDPDIIVLGEMRDLETISLALTAAETGHLVLGTLHTGSAIRTVNRILGVFPPQEQSQIRSMVSESLRAVVSQRLLTRSDGRGRVPALEILLNTKAVGNLIRENKTFQIRSVMQTGASRGMCLLDASLTELVRQGTVTREEAMRHAEDPKRFAAEPRRGGGA